MRKILIEVGFDWHVGTIGRMAEDPDLKLKLRPLQHGWVRLESGQGHPMWPTQLQDGDELSFKIFDVTREYLEPRSEGLQPVRFEAHFQHPNQSDKPRQVFANISVPIQVPDAAQRWRLDRSGQSESFVFGYHEKQANAGKKGRFESWAISGPNEQTPCRFRKPGSLKLERALMALVLVVEGAEQRTFVLDPELYVGPFGSGGGLRPPV